ncbi:MAG TPA: tetratricopeptide repeat protein [Balneolales bacterium]|nr:tetratricopeptide repeat protein [Balneolales bacterium]
MAQQAQAQSKTDAVKAFNAAFKMSQNGQIKQAIQKFEDTIQLCDKVGKSAADIKKKAEQQLPPLNYRLAAQYYKQKNIAASVKQFEKTYQIAKKYGNNNIAKRSKENVPKLYYFQGNSAYQQGNYQAALKAYDNAIQKDPQYAKAYYQKGLTYMKMDKSSDATHLQVALKMWDQAISIGKKADDGVTVRHAKQAASGFLVYKGANASQHKHYSEGIKLLKKSLNYNNTNPNAYYRLAQAYNNIEKYHEAIQNAKTALKYEKGGKTDKAKIWFELGSAYQKLNDKDQACKAFQNSAYGSFKASADHAMKYELKCKSATASK